ncbi:MAG: helix-turn-helix domain-containing protein [Thermomonas sp.]|uniref:helix-turn-helix domain-containing protein n=1 Tax=Thermomonas sp. TaxID=1971895 RepID=UPI001ED568EE|nr:helix-turn-helix domain-containing protein [Thermomonas sp.]MBV2210289.1 helix-turn-helix domain-containing protein [Thermomonas sp.]
MEQLNKLLDKIKETRSLASDNALAESLGVKRQTVSNWRKERTLPDAVQCATIAGLTGEPLARVLGIVGEARAISKEEKKVWRRLAAIVSLGIVSLGIAFSNPANARDADGQQIERGAVTTMHYAKLLKGGLS